MKPAYAVGVCLTATGAVIAAVRTDPLRLAALAEVATPSGLWTSDAGGRPAAAAGRTVARARRRLGLSRWCPVTVVGGPSLGAEVAAGSTATLLARAGLAVARVVEAERLGLHTDGVAVDEPLRAALVDAEHALALAAALCMLDGPGPAADDDRSGIGDGEWDAAAGWAVERIGPAREPLAPTTTNSR
ncbi:hypothetical protein O7635_28200 [Asanoa sp. WMMD1127]|uniref:hypothetical protein n=1 Tax=Asanoa sp. WMMD1127 TaxID=3016107 RepID=UPI002417FC91|nr:hypothetical protein [Asanoa sp. WMMD1127]MDG4825747.1 hypothetical protein [Asanoa sp. WMMD1127]